MIIRLDQTDSTNTYLAAHICGMRHGDAVTAHTQSAGRGQRGNSWEAEPGCNVTMSMLLVPEETGLQVHAARAFPLSEAVALGVADVAESLIAPYAGEDEIAIKWPNDIYAGNRKIAGILIENSLRGSQIGRSIVGIGLNVNQLEFRSDAPNPVSVVQLTGMMSDLQRVSEQIVDRVLSRVRMLIADEEQLHDSYMKKLWRGRGVHPFVDSRTGENFDAEVVSVAPSGHITLRHAPEGTLREYAFKEIGWELP